MSKSITKLILTIAIFLILQLFIQPAIADGRINLDFYYSSS